MHRVHDAWVPVLWLLPTAMLASCVFPPDLSVETSDGGVNSPPAITAVRSNDQELPEPGPVNFERGLNAGTMSVSLVDTDVDDTLYVSIFVEYYITDPKPPRVECIAAPTGTSKRTATCDLTRLCEVADVGKLNQFMTVQVFDREPLLSGSPAYKVMPAGGMTTSRSYLLNCTDPT